VIRLASPERSNVHECPGRPSLPVRLPPQQPGLGGERPSELYQPREVLTQFVFPKAGFSYRGVSVRIHRVLSDEAAPLLAGAIQRKVGAPPPVPDQSNVHRDIRASKARRSSSRSLSGHALKHPDRRQRFFRSPSSVAQWNHGQPIRHRGL
jgi:hypothetical protein